MDINLRRLDEIYIISIAGSMDALEASRISGCMYEPVSNGGKYFVFDLEEVEFMSSAGLKAILGALKNARRQGGNLVIAGAKGGVGRVLEITGFSKILKTYDSVELAVAAFGG
jgi:anti-sigma B factor antagonist